MVAVYLSLGSNIDKEYNIVSAITQLKRYFPQLVCSPVYETEAVGFEGDNFYNLVIGIETKLSLPSLQCLIRLLEFSHGRVRNSEKFNSRTLDIDILLYGDCTGCHTNINLPRNEILKYAFVLKPLADIAPQLIHPILHISYQNLWSEYSTRQEFKTQHLTEASLFF